MNYSYFIYKLQNLSNFHTLLFYPLILLLFAQHGYVKSFLGEKKWHANKRFAISVLHKGNHIIIKKQIDNKLIFNQKSKNYGVFLRNNNLRNNAKYVFSIVLRKMEHTQHILSVNYF